MKKLIKHQLSPLSHEPESAMDYLEKILHPQKNKKAYPGLDKDDPKNKKDSMKWLSGKYKYLSLCDCADGEVRTTLRGVNSLFQIKNKKLLPLLWKKHKCKPLILSGHSLTADIRQKLSLDNPKVHKVTLAGWTEIACAIKHLQCRKAETLRQLINREDINFKKYLSEGQSYFRGLAGFLKKTLYPRKEVIIDFLNEKIPPAKGKLMIEKLKRKYHLPVAVVDGEPCTSVRALCILLKTYEQNLRLIWKDHGLELPTCKNITPHLRLKLKLGRNASNILLPQWREILCPVLYLQNDRTKEIRENLEIKKEVLFPAKPYDTACEEPQSGIQRRIMNYLGPRFALLSDKPESNEMAYGKDADAMFANEHFRDEFVDGDCYSPLGEDDLSNFDREHYKKMKDFLRLTKEMDTAKKAHDTFDEKDLYTEDEEAFYTREDEEDFYSREDEEEDSKDEEDLSTYERDYDEDEGEDF